MPPLPRETVAALDPAMTAGRGARVNFVEQEAENAATTGEVIGPDTAAYTLAAEASGRMAVKLSLPGQYVEFTLTRDANVITLRYSIPDSPNGGGIDAPIELTATRRHGSAPVEARTLTLTSKYSWFYGVYPFTNDPGFEPEPGPWKPEPDPVVRPFRPNHFYDELRVMLGRTFHAGDTVRLTMPESGADWYVIDLMDFEVVEPPQSAPDGSLSVVDFGADPAGAIESSDAFDAAIAAAKSGHSAVFIPPGTYRVDRHIIVDDVTLRGAGNWWSVVRGSHVTLAAPLPDGSTHTGVGFYGKPAYAGGSSNVHMSGFAIEGDVRERIDRDAVNGVGGALNDSTIDGLYIHHTKVGLWLDGPMNNLAVTNTIVVDTMADGINFCSGVTNSRVSDCFFRNNGDDGMAMWSRAADPHNPEGIENSGNVFHHNTIQTPVLANCIAIYGGRDNLVSNNIAADPIREGSGLHAGQRFRSTPFTGRLTFRDNTTIRAGTFEMRWGIGLGAIWFYALDGPIDATVDVRGDRYLDCIYNAIMFIANPQAADRNVIGNVRFRDITVDGTGTSIVSARSKGSASFERVVARNVGGSGVNMCVLFGRDDVAPFRIVDLGGNDDWIGDVMCDDCRPPSPAARR
jgi:hypothetical protein